MAIDTSAFDKYRKSAPQTGNPITNVDISAFGYAWNNDLDGTENTTQIYKPITPAEYGTSTRAEGSGVVSTIFKSVPGMIKESLSNYLEEERKIRADLTLGQDFTRTFVKKPAAIYKNTLQFLAQGIGGGLLSLGRSTQETIIRPFVGKERAQEIVKPKGEPFGVNWDQLIGGEERVRTYSEIGDDLRKYLDESPIATPTERAIIPVTVPFVLFALDALPFKANPKKAVTELLEDLAKSATKREAEKLLIKQGINKNIAARLAPKLVSAETKEAVQQVIKDEFDDSLENLLKLAGKDAPAVVRSATGEAVTTEQATARAAARATGEAVDAIPTVARRNAPDIEISRTRIASVLDQIEQPDLFDRALKVIDVEDIDTRVRLLAEGKTPDEKLAKSIADELKNISAVERDLFAKERNIDIKTPEGQQQFLDEFVKKFGVQPDDITPEFVQRVLARRGSAPSVVSAATRQAQTTVEVAGKSVKTNTDVAPEVKVKQLQDGSIDAGAITDLAKRDQTTLKPIRATGQVNKKGRDLAKEVAANVNKYNAKLKDKEVAKIREQNLLGKETIDEIIARKRGIITDVEAIERAKSIKGTLEDVINLPKGTTVTKEQKTAIEQIIQEEREINKAISTLIDNGGKSSTPAERELIKALGEEYQNLSEAQLLNYALAESTKKLKKAEIVYLGIRAETGRALQSMNKIADSVDKRLRILMNKINGSNMSDIEKQAFIERVAEYDIKDNKTFIKLLDELVKPDFFDKVAEWSVAAKLWNPTTHVVNFGGNTLRQVADVGIKTITNPMTAKADLMGAAVGLKRGVKNSLKALTDDGYANQLSKYAETGGDVPAIGGTLGKAVRTPFRFLAASDEIFRNMAYQRKLYRDAYRAAKDEGLKGNQLNARMEELLNYPTFDMMDAATKEAKRMTFQEDLGGFMRQVDNLRNPKLGKNLGDKAIRTGIRFFLPFLKTPTNLFKQAIDFSPVGLLKNYPKLKAAVKKGDKEAVGTILGEAIFGTAIATYIAMETLEGNVTGGAPRDAAKKDRFYRENKIPYAIKVGDTWYQYKRVDPFASIVGLTADMVTLEEKNFGSLLGVVAENLKDKTYLSGVSDLMKVLTGEDWERDYALKSMLLGAALPSFVGHTTRSIDSNIRVADTLGQRLLVQVPGMSENFPTRVNVLGYDVQRANKGLNYFFNPIQMESAEIDPVTQELMELDKTIAVPQDYFSRNKVKYEFTPSEYEDYARYVGLKLRYDLIDLFKTPQYQNGDIEKKIALIDKLRKQIQDEYKDAYVKEKTSATEDRVQQAKNILQGKDANTPKGEDAIRTWFLGQ